MLYHWRDLAEIAPNYDDCGMFCPELDEPKEGLCSECPIKDADKDFVENLTEMLDKRCPNQWQKYGIDNLRRTVSDVMRLEQSNAERTITTDALISIVESERGKMRRVDDWNENQRRKADRNN